MINKPNPQIVKKCSRCGCEYTLSEFQRLPFVSRWDLTGGEPSQIENRNCQCNTTLGLELDRDGNYYQTEGE